MSSSRTISAPYQPFMGDSSSGRTPSLPQYLPDIKEDSSDDEQIEHRQLSDVEQQLLNKKLEEARQKSEVITRGGNKQIKLKDVLPDFSVRDFLGKGKESIPPPDFSIAVAKNLEKRLGLHGSTTIPCPLCYYDRDSHFFHKCCSRVMCLTCYMEYNMRFSTNRCMFCGTEEKDMENLSMITSLNLKDLTESFYGKNINEVLQLIKNMKSQEESYPQNQLRLEDDDDRIIRLENYNYSIKISTFTTKFKFELPNPTDHYGTFAEIELMKKKETVGPNIHLVNLYDVSSSMHSSRDELDQVRERALEQVKDKANIRITEASFGSHHKVLGKEIRVTSSNIFILKKTKLEIGGGTYILETAEYTLDLIEQTKSKYEVVIINIITDGDLSDGSIPKLKGIFDKFSELGVQFKFYGVGSSYNFNICRNLTNNDPTKYESKPDISKINFGMTEDIDAVIKCEGEIFDPASVNDETIKVIHFPVISSSKTTIIISSKTPVKLTIFEQEIIPPLIDQSADFTLSFFESICAQTSLKLLIAENSRNVPNLLQFRIWMQQFNDLIEKGIELFPSLDTKRQQSIHDNLRQIHRTTQKKLSDILESFPKSGKIYKVPAQQPPGLQQSEQPASRGGRSRRVASVPTSLSDYNDEIAEAGRVISCARVRSEPK